MGLTVVTHRIKNSTRDMTKCIESVNAALTDGMTHKVIEIPKGHLDLIYARFNAMYLDDFIVFVDDDDFISKDSLKNCYNALVNSSVGFVYTKEIQVLNTGKMIISPVSLLYSDLIKHPGSIHHMTAFRTSCITEKSLQVALAAKYELTAWVMKLEAAKYGAIHIPEVGYYYVRHDKQMTNFYKTELLSGISYVQKATLGWEMSTTEILVI